MPGGRVLVVGGVLPDGGSISLYACAFAVGLVAGEVVFISHDVGLREKAAAIGARPVLVKSTDYPDGDAPALRRTH